MRTESGLHLPPTDSMTGSAERADTSLIELVESGLHPLPLLVKSAKSGQQHPPPPPSPLVESAKSRQRIHGCQMAPPFQKSWGHPLGCHVCVDHGLLCVVCELVMCVSTMGCYVLCVGGEGTFFELSLVADVLHTWFCRDHDGCHVKMHVHVQPSLSHTCTILVFQATSVPSSVILSCKLCFD